MPYVRSLLDGAENTVSGSLMVSTLGGGTATTEFEVLSGSSMVFLPVGGAPYQMFVRMQTPGPGIRPAGAGLSDHSDAPVSGFVLEPAGGLYAFRL